MPDRGTGRGEGKGQRAAAHGGQHGGQAEGRQAGAQGRAGLGSGAVWAAVPSVRSSGLVHGSAPSTITMATFAMTRAMLISHTPPTAARASTAGCCHWLAPYTAHGPPRACQDRSHSVSSQQLGTTISAASARGHVTGGRSSQAAATPNGTHSTPTTAATSSTAGPISGDIQYSAAIR